MSFYVSVVVYFLPSKENPKGRKEKNISPRSNVEDDSKEKELLSNMTKQISLNEKAPFHSENFKTTAEIHVELSSLVNYTIQLKKKFCFSFSLVVFLFKNQCYENMAKKVHLDGGNTGKFHPCIHELFVFDQSWKRRRRKMF